MTSPASSSATLDAAAPSQLVAVAGRGVLPPDALVVGADDLGLTRGDGVFDATRVLTGDDGTSFAEHLERHLERLDHSVQGLGDGPISMAEWRELVGQALEAWTAPVEATLKLMYTRGLESRASEPVRLLTITAMTPAALAQRDGITVAALPRGYASDAFIDAPWLLGGVKTLSYAVNVAAKREAARRGADDVLFTSSDGFCLEGPTAALVVAQGDGLVTTPTGGTGILDSITQKLVFAAAQAEGVAGEYRLLRPEELADSRGVWLVSSVRGAAPVRELDGVALPFDAGLDARMKGWCGF